MTEMCTQVRDAEEIWFTGAFSLPIADGLLERVFAETHNLRKLFLFSRLVPKHPLRDAIIRALAPAEHQVPSAALKELHLWIGPGDRFLYLEALENILSARKARGIPLQMLAIHFGRLGERTKLVEWSGQCPREALARKRLTPLVGTLRFARVKGSLPQMELVSICRSQSDGPWNWPVWK